MVLPSVPTLVKILIQLVMMTLEVMVIVVGEPVVFMVGEVMGVMEWVALAVTEQERISQHFILTTGSSPLGLVVIIMMVASVMKMVGEVGASW
jgi:hypothetical protein